MSGFGKASPLIVGSQTGFLHEAVLHYQLMCRAASDLLDCTENRKVDYLAFVLVSVWKRDSEKERERERSQRSECVNVSTAGSTRWLTRWWAKLDWHSFNYHHLLPSERIRCNRMLISEHHKSSLIQKINASVILLAEMLVGNSCYCLWKHAYIDWLLYIRTAFV